MNKGVVNPLRTQEDIVSELTLRPKDLNEFVGQEKVVEKISLFVKAALQRGEALDHTILYGPPGLGKTTLAYIIANEMGKNIKCTSGPALDRKDDLAAILTDLKQGDILFIDEIHRLNHIVEECLYPAIEEFRIDIIIGEGPSAKSIKIELPQFTLVGATTRIGSLSPPFRSRFGITERLDFYSEDAMLKIVKRSAGILNIEIDNEGAKEISRRSRGTPRIANRLLRRVRDFAQVKHDNIITTGIAASALKMFDVDEIGLDTMDKIYLQTLIEKFSGGPVGLNNLSVLLGEEAETIEDVFEPYLIQIGFVKRTPKGRVATKLAYNHLGFDFNDKEHQIELF